MTYRKWWGRVVFILATGLAASAFAANGNNDNSGSSTGDIVLSERIVIYATPETVWQTVCDFDALSVWHPSIEGSDITSGENNKPGAKRHLTFKGDGSAEEQLISWNHQKMRYTYRILGGDLPVSHYRSTIAVQPKGDKKSTLIWEGVFDSDSEHSDAQARQAIRRFYRVGLLHVKTMLGAASG